MIEGILASTDSGCDIAIDDTYLFSGDCGGSGSPPPPFPCASGGQVDYQQVCDMVEDCADGSDEVNCGKDVDHFVKCYRRVSLFKIVFLSRSFQRVQAQRFVGTVWQNAQKAWGLFYDSKRTRFWAGCSCRCQFQMAAQTLQPQRFSLLLSIIISTGPLAWLCCRSMTALRPSDRHFLSFPLTTGPWLEQFLSHRYI